MRIAVALLCLISFYFFTPVNSYAAPFGTRFFIDAPTEASTASRIDLTVELYDQATGLRTTTSGVSVTLRLYRCPGYPSSCSPVVVNASVVVGNTVNGLVSFPNVVVDSINSDYYFVAVASGYSSGTTQVFDVVEAKLRVEGVTSATITTSSRLPVQVTVRRGTSIDSPVDLMADGVNIRLGLLSCPGYPMSCSVVIVNSNIANAVATNGVANFGTFGMPSTGTDRYLVATTLAPDNLSPVTSEVFDVEQSYLLIQSMSAEPISTASRMSLQAVFRVGLGVNAPIDTLATGVNVRLALYTCPGFPNSCSPSSLNSNFANMVSSNGVANFTGLNLNTTGADRYFSSTAPGLSGIITNTSVVFDVVQASLWFTGIPSVVFIAHPFNIVATIRAGTGSNAPVDVLADGINVRPSLLSCVGYPNSCSVAILNSNFANSVTTDGIAIFNNMLINSGGDDRYFYPTTPGVSGITSHTTHVFDVVPLLGLIFKNSFE